MRTKRCYKCKEFKDTTEFFKSRNTKDGLDACCKVCAKIKRQKYAKENAPKIKAKLAHYQKVNADKIKIQRQGYAENNAEKLIWDGMKRRSQKNSWKFTTTIEEIKFPIFCPVFPYNKLATTRGRGRGPDSPSVDRIDSTKGYDGNFEIISWRPNDLKKDSTFEERILLVLHDLKRHNTENAKQATTYLRTFLSPETLRAVLHVDNLNTTGQHVL